MFKFLDDERFLKKFCGESASNPIYKQRRCNILKISAYFFIASVMMIFANTISPHNYFLVACTIFLLAGVIAFITYLITKYAFEKKVPVEVE